MSSRTTPEQILGNLFQFIITLKQKGLRINRRTQALGSAAVDTLRREGWVIVRYDDVPKSESKSESRVGSTWLCDLPCPDCGELRVIGYLLTNERGEHAHTHYVCTFWRSGLKPDLSASLHKRCGWSGWSVPGWDKDET